MADLELESLGNGDGNNYLLRDNSKIPLSGSNQISGSLIPSTNETVNLGSSSNRYNTVYTFQVASNNYARLDMCGGLSRDNGGTLSVHGKDLPDSNFAGTFLLRATDGSAYADLLGTPSGTLTWVGKNVAMQEDVVPRSGGAVMSGNLFRTADDGTFVIGGGKAYTTGASIYMRGALHASEPGWIYLSPRSGQTYKYMILKPDGSLTWNGTAIQYTSDQRLKQQISNIDDKLLDAWEDVEPVQFKYNDAVETKSDNARLHTGYVVQQIDEACQKHDVDISNYGLYCHEEYSEETEEVEVTQDDGTTTKERKVIREASEHYSLRYTETLVVECAYLRREVSKLKQQNENLEQRLKMLEQSVK